MHEKLLIVQGKSCTRNWLTLLGEENVLWIVCTAVHCVLCLTVLQLPLDKIPFAAQLNNNNDKIPCNLILSNCFVCVIHWKLLLFSNEMVKRQQRFWLTLYYPIHRSYKDGGISRKNEWLVISGNVLVSPTCCRIVVMSCVSFPGTNS
jgi:hypothetical protein